VRVLFGVASEGIGHAITSGVIKDHLIQCGHSIQFACAKGTRACQHLARYGPVVSVAGLTIAHDKSGRTNHLRTIGANLKNLALMNVEPWLLTSLPRPDVVITDFEPVTARYANLLNLPLIAINNIHAIDRCVHPKEIIDPYRRLAAVSLPAATNVVPNAHRYMVPSFVGLPVRKARTTLHLPILERMPESEDGDDVLVYFNEKAPWANIVRTLATFDSVKFRCYGSGKVGSQGNITLCPPSDAFAGDFARSKAVIGGSGFTLVARSIYSRKPLLAVPAEGHLEQGMNSSYLAALGFGAKSQALTLETLGAFLEKADSYRNNLQPVVHDGNVGLLTEIDRILS
jgi:uncharacterized protein (TIGR00661 family)